MIRIEEYCAVQGDPITLYSHPSCISYDKSLNYQRLEVKELDLHSDIRALQLLWWFTLNQLFSRSYCSRSVSASFQNLRMSQSSVHTREQNEVPVWQLDEEVQSCFLCHKKFTLFFRRHHCRRCGKVVCAQCSTTSTVYEIGTYVVTPPSQVFMESPHVPHRTCDLCVEQLVTDGVAMDNAPPAPVNVPSNSGINGNRAALVHGSNQIKDASQQRTLVVNETDDDDAEMDDDSEINHCPICGFDLQTITGAEREQHIDECISNAAFSGSPTQFRSNRMLVYHIPFPDDSKKLVVSCSETSNSTLQQRSMSNVDEKFPGDDECVICLEELKPGEKVGRLECLCVFHYKCIRNWFKRKGPGECPVHAVHI